MCDIHIHQTASKEEKVIDLTLLTASKEEKVNSYNSLPRERTLHFPRSIHIGTSLLFKLTKVKGVATYNLSMKIMLAFL